MEAYSLRNTFDVREERITTKSVDRLTIPYLFMKTQHNNTLDNFFSKYVKKDETTSSISSFKISMYPRYRPN